MTIIAQYGESDSSEPAPPVESDHGDVLCRAKELQAEVEQFAAHLCNVYRGYFQEFPQNMHISFYHDVLSEVQNLENDINSEDPFSAHRISSSNLPYLHAVWSTAKSSKNIVKLRHPVFSGPFKRRILAPGIRIKDILSQGGSEPKRNQNGRSTRIDVICDGGLLWYKVSTITNRRLLFDMAKESIYCGDSDDSDSSSDTSQDFSDVPLVKMARTLKTIAQGHQIRNTTPTICLVLPRIQEGEYVEVDKIVKFCRDMDVNVSCGDKLPVSLPLSDDLLHEMVPSPKRNITSELNIDTSVLVALTSDISHLRVTPQSWFGQSQKDHIDLEAHDPLTPQLCSLLGNHQLVCTKEAAASLARIVHTMGTVTENARAHLLLTPDDTKTREQRLEEFRALSIHASSMPSCLQLPIRVLDSDTNLDQDVYQIQSDALIQEKLNSLAQPGRSVFSSGWAKGLTTITCNVLAVKQLEKNLEELPSLDISQWPSIWAFSSSRPLVGVRKGSSEQRIRKHIGDCRATCICGLDEFKKGQVSQLAC
ncbi:hypothetical protein F5B22DRAFT_646487 [Xylaria bambusicola]|uniref:uncharacterized protein n=1 Tax=Xylaria bambusicola TaxID=326684 RepID=UPI0020073DEE|nr:uncharacterized protein F5B22DRAFT_646487 [Xylaria bambusicola]KAI0516749.1 hypothetical protein F5B22DRAFT_646487 [Xylaria bambusicola]